MRDKEKELLEDLDGWIADREAQMVEDIRRLVRIPSISKEGQEPYWFGEECFRAAACMREMAEAYGFETQDCGGRCIRIRYGEGEKRIEVWNHLDVVPEGKGWVYEPYACERVGDFLIGRGVSDNKGPAVAVLYALRYLKEHAISLPYSLSQICGLSEETGMADAAWYVETCGSPDFAVISDCRFPLCYGEKGRCRIKVRTGSAMEHIRILQAGTVSNSVAQKALLVLEGQCRADNGAKHTADEQRITMTARGIAGHAAAPERCVNPIGILAAQVEERRELILSEQEKKLFHFLRLACNDGYGEGLGIGREDPVFGKMSCAGTLLSMEDGHAALEFDLRIPPSIELQELLEELAGKAKAWGLDIVETECTSGYKQDLHSPYIQALLSAYYRVMGKGEEPYVMGGNTYARFFTAAAGFGPGIPKDYSALKLPAGHGGGHGCDEVQSVSSLCSAVKVYVLAFLRLAEL